MTLKAFGKKIEGVFARIKQRRIVYVLLHKVGLREVLMRHADDPFPDVPIGKDCPVWILWWQGEAQMPDIVRASVNSIRLHAGSHKVVMLTKDNFSDYADIPPYILQKMETGAITLTHFSDILRATLQSQHGGIWMDSTVLLPRKSLDDFIPADKPFWTCHHRPIYHNISRGGWTGFFWACGAGNPLATTLRDLFFRYWEKRDSLIVYLLIDYTFALTRRYVPAVAQMVEAVPITVMGPLGKRLNEPYSPEAWEAYCTDYDFHKLTYKITLNTHTPDGRLTNYGYILEQFLPRG